MAVCKVCPRKCCIDRGCDTGFCGEGDKIRVSKIMLHKWEEPCISVGEGSGAVFFSGCSLRCVYCQNGKISGGGAGRLLSTDELADVFLVLQKKGAANINLVTPTHFALQIEEALKKVRNELHIPVVWNTSGYERKETIERLCGLADVFLTDFKYASSELSARYSGAPDYPIVALEALEAMVRITGKPRFDGDALCRGTIVRHLVLPSHYRDSIEVLHLISECVGSENVLLSLMSQYTPEFLSGDYPEISRRITTFEYEKALSEAERLGFDGYMQARASASREFTPDFGDGIDFFL